MIPKIIHYCWFGHNPKPKLTQKCINSWKKYCPDYEIIEWNEDNYSLSSAPLFVRQAIDAKKWAFATDYIRYQVIYENGGIYLDTDVELIKTLDTFLSYSAYFGFEDEKYIASGLGFGAEQANCFIAELMHIYENIPFIRNDGTYDTRACPQREKDTFCNHGLKLNNTEQILDGGLHIFPSDYFAPKDYKTNQLKITKNTVSIHWYVYSWGSKKQKFLLRYDNLIHIPNRIGMRVLGIDRYNKLKTAIKKRT